MMLIWVPKILMLMILGLAVISYFLNFKIKLKYLIIGALALLVINGGVLTWLQYEAWEHSELARYLLPPHQSIKYFISYSWMHFWINPIFSFGLALVFSSMLFIIRKARKDFFQNNDIGSGFLSVLIAGWHNFIVFFVLALILMLIISLYFKIFKKRDYPSFALPFLIAALVAAIFGNSVMGIIGLSALMV